MNNMSKFEKEYYAKEGKYTPMDPNIFYDDVSNYMENNVENVPQED